jgi:hypothetical protein
MFRQVTKSASVYWLFLFAWVASHPSHLLACNIPVFRYALERWNPDTVKVLIFYDGSLQKENEAIIARFEMETTARGGTTNAEVIRINVSGVMGEKERSCWNSIQKDAQVKFPYVAIQFSLSNNRSVTPWHGPLSELSLQLLRESPARNELAKRFLAGHSVVWLLVKSNDEAKNRMARKLVDEELSVLEKKIKLPEGIGLPGSELYSEIPLLVKFSVLELDPKDPKELLLVKLFQGFESTQTDEPLLVPVFGKGRALEVLPASQVDAPLIGDLTMFLCGACSCQVKERNPGFDLWMSVDWNQELFGESGEVPEPVSTLARKSSTPKTLVIPPGKSK